MKEPITKFDLEAAFKALDEIEVPVAEKGIKANKPALTEIFSRKSKFDSLMEEYYDIGNTEELSDAKEAREAEVAKAKLARIEKIVDLDAESPEELLTSYVGKLIMQCPQCMTLFYKNPEDIEDSEEEPGVVNVNEVCQHCGNDSGYTLIGKVGEATQEEVDDMQDVQEVDVDSTEDSGEELDLEIEDDEAVEEGSEDFDLEALDLDLEDEEVEEEKTEESFTNHDGELLVEELHEEVDLEVSAEEFEDLIKSPEFKKPVSDSSARAMMQEFSDSEEEEVEEALEEEVKVNNETLKYAVINPDGTFAGVPCTSEEEARELAAQKEGRVIVELGAVKEDLQEGIFDKLKDKFTDTVSKIADKLKTREAKANWVLANALEDYNNIKTNKEGELIPDESNQRFGTFVIIGFKNEYSNGKEITSAPSFNNKELVMGMRKPQAVSKYEKADDIAKGWSMSQGNGPAFIYLAKNAEDDKAVFLCEYFKGELVNDQLEKYFEVVKKHLKGAKLMARGGMDDSTEEALEKEGSLNLENAKSKDLKFFATEIFNHFNKKYSIDVVDGYKIHIINTKTDITAEINKVNALAENNQEAIAEKLTDGTYAYKLKPVEETPATESLSAIMDNLEELQESTLEAMISDSLVEAYGNVAGFRLKDCTYLNEKFKVNGTIHFTSGNTRTTSYIFTEALNAADGKFELQGFNEKLGLDKQFTLKGYTENKTFITESFSRS
jgi:hypothetical protein